MTGALHRLSPDPVVKKSALEELALRAPAASLWPRRPGVYAGIL